MASEITEEDDEDSYFLHNKEAHKEKIRQLIKHQKNQYQSSSSSSSTSSSSSSSVALRSSCSSSDQNQNRKLLNLMKKGSTSLRRLFDMEHTSLANHFDFYSCSPETITIPLWGSDSDDAIHEDPWTGITKFQNRFIYIQEHHEIFEKRQEHEEQKEYVLENQKLTRKKSFNKLPRFYKLRFRFRFRLKPRLRFCFRIWRGKKKAYEN